MSCSESEVEQQCPATYAEYVGGLEYNDDEMEKGDDLSLANFNMELRDVPMPSVQINGEFLELPIF
jgi:hypothetical protein